MIGSQALIKLWRDRLFSQERPTPQQQRREAAQRLIAQSHPDAPSFIVDDGFSLDDGGVYGVSKPPGEADRIWKEATKGLTSLGSIDDGS